MKTLIALLAAIAIAGCTSQPGGTGGIPPKEDRCAAYANALALYQAATVFRDPTEDEIKGAKAATAFLAASCGWQRARAVDSWGVPVIAKP